MLGVRDQLLIIFINRTVDSFALIKGKLKKRKSIHCDFCISDDLAVFCNLMSPFILIKLGVSTLLIMVIDLFV